MVILEKVHFTSSTLPFFTALLRLGVRGRRLRGDRRRLRDESDLRRLLRVLLEGRGRGLQGEGNRRLRERKLRLLQREGIGLGLLHEGHKVHVVLEHHGLLLGSKCSLLLLMGSLVGSNIISARVTFVGTVVIRRPPAAAILFL